MQSLESAVSVSQSPGRSRRRPSISTDPASLIALRAAPTAPTPATRRRVRVIRVPVSSTGSDRNRYSLHDAPMVVTSRVHSVVDGEVTADQVRTHSRILAGQRLCLANDIRLVFAVIDAHNTRVSGRRAE